MKSLRKLLKFVSPYRRDAILSLLLLIGMVLSDLGIPRLTQRVIDEGINKQDMNVILTTALIMIGVALLSALFSIGNTILSVRVGQGVGADLRSAVVRKVQSFSFGNLDHLQTGQLLVRATSDVTQVQTMVMMSLRMLTRAPLWMLGSVLMLVLNSPQIALIMVALVPFVLGVIWLFMAKARPLFLVVQEKLDVLNQVLQENLAGVRVVKAFVRRDYENARFAKVNMGLTDETFRVMRSMALLMPTMTFIVNLGIVGVIWFGGNAVVAGTLTVGQIVSSFNYLLYSLFPMLMLAAMIGPLSAADASAGRVLEILENMPEVQERESVQDAATFHVATWNAVTFQGRIVFEDVTFSYNGKDHEPVLKNISLVAEPGETVAILGATGSGKSSLVNLIPRFYDVSTGRVLLDGVDMRDLPLHKLRSQVGMAMQEAVLFSGTIRDNIRYGKPDATDAEVLAAAKAAQAHDFIMEFPDGYDTLVGQRGANLSGGQKQRLSIARALLVQPIVLILDDSTSAVDVETEVKIQDALDDLMANRTSFVIAQRISTVLNADKIVVLDRGVVTAIGTHTELMESSPIYREIYESQLGQGGGCNG